MSDKRTIVAEDGKLLDRDGKIVLDLSKSLSDVHNRDGATVKALVFTGSEIKASEPATSGTILKISGYASTKDVDRYNEIVEPSAFDGAMAEYMAFPVILVNHAFSETPVGKVTSYRIDDKGLWIEAEIIDTEKGREVAALIKAGVFRAFSIGFNVVSYEVSRDDSEPLKITKLQLIEISIVSSPANMQALISQAEERSISVKSLINHQSQSPVAGRERKEVNVSVQDIDVKKTVDESLTPIKEKVDNQEARVSDVQKSFDKVAKTQKDITDALENVKTSDAETKALIERVQKELMTQVETLSKDVARVNDRKRITGIDFGSHSVKALVSMEPTELAKSIPQAVRDNTLVLHELNDKCLIVDALLAASSQNNGGSYHRAPRNARIKSLNSWKEFNEFAKAMDTSTTAEGAEFIPDALSGSLLETIRHQEMVAPLFQQIMVPNSPFTIPTNGAATLATLAGQVATVVAAFDSTEQTPTTGEMTFTAKKARGRYQISTELTEDSAIAIFPFARGEIVKSIARATDRAIINGQLGGYANLDSGTAIAASDYRLAWNGLRYFWYAAAYGNNAAGLDLSTFSYDNLTTLRGKMGLYAMYPSQLAWLTSVSAYLKRFLSLDEVLTLDKLGPNATVLSGQVLTFQGAPVVVSEFMQENLNASGIYDASTTDKTAILLVNREVFKLGIRRDVEILVERDNINDVYQMVAFKRQDFQPTITPSSSVNPVGCGYAIAS